VPTISPATSPGSVDARMDRKQRRSGHAVLQAGHAARRSKRVPTAGRGPDAPSEREDLRPGEDQASWSRQSSLRAHEITVVERTLAYQAQPQRLRWLILRCASQRSGVRST
jgi:hypothetical protein